jgi:hypothetical protein
MTSASVTPELLRQTATGHMAARAIQAAVKLGLFDALGLRAKPSASIAEELGLHAGATRRLLRGLAAIGLAMHEPPDGFAISDLGQLLDRNHPSSLRNLVMLFGSERSLRSWERLEIAVQTGRSQARELYGMDGFEYFRRHPQEGRIFHAAMAEASARIAQDLVRALDFTRYESIADIGGGNGELLAAILLAAPDARGVLFDLPQAVESAPQRLERDKLGHRCEIKEGDFFSEVPSGLSLYVLKNVLHDWADEDCVRILTQVRRAMASTSRLLIVERVLPTHVAVCAADRQATLMDLNMLVTAGGCERTKEEFAALLGHSGFALSEVRQLEGGHRFSVVRARPAANV